MSKYAKVEDVIRAIAEQLCWEARTEYGDKFTTEDWLEEAEDYVSDLPTIEVSEGNQVLYGTDHNCILTMFGECSYNETGCGDCAVAEKIRKALSVEVSDDMVSRKDFEDVIRRMGERNCFTCGIYHEGEWTLMARNPEKVTAEELEENDRAVSLAEVCKIIQDTHEVCPATWGRLRNAPSVVPTTEQSSKVGEWKPFDRTWGREIWACSVCEESVANMPTNGDKPLYDYCPNCGAKMKG